MLFVFLAIGQPMFTPEKTILVILHRSNGDVGKIGTLLRQDGYQLEIRCPIAGDSLPDPKAYQAVILFGGLMSANDCQIIPAIRHEIDWIPSVIAAEVPYLGVCLGAQLLARALGAGVARKPDNSVEIGFHHVRPTTHCQSLLPPQGMRFYQWHVEGFTIPQSCERLAESDNFPNQAFRLDARTIGLQFHPEATRTMIDYWVAREPEYLALKGAQSYKTQIELLREYDQTITQWLTLFLRRWLAGELR